MKDKTVNELAFALYCLVNGYPVKDYTEAVNDYLCIKKKTWQDLVEISEGVEEDASTELLGNVCREALGIIPSFVVDTLNIKDDAEFIAQNYIGRTVNAVDILRLLSDYVSL